MTICVCVCACAWSLAHMTLANCHCPCPFSAITCRMIMLGNRQGSPMVIQVQYVYLCWCSYHFISSIYIYSVYFGTIPRIVGADLCTTSRFHSSMSSMSSMFRAFLGGALLISMSIFALMMWKVRALADSTERTTGLHWAQVWSGRLSRQPGLIFMGHGAYRPWESPCFRIWNLVYIPTPDLWQGSRFTLVGGLMCVCVCVIHRRRLHHVFKLILLPLWRAPFSFFQV